MESRHTPRSLASGHLVNSSLTKLLAVATLCLVFASAAAEAQEQEMTIDHRQAAVLVRALGHDRHLPARAGTDVHIGVLGKANLPASEQAARAMTIAFQGLAGTLIQGLPVKASLLGYAGGGRLGELLEREGIDVLYVCPGLEAELQEILALTRRRQLLSLAGVMGYVDKGASLGVFTVEGSPTVFINLAASKREGAAFGSELLRLARVIR
jgi:hypothetical protein